MIKIDLYRSCVCSKDFICEIYIWEWLLRKPEGLVKIVDMIRSSTDQAEIKRLKLTFLPVATISGNFLERSLAGLKCHSGLICIDIDGKDNPDVTDIKDLKIILSKLDYIMYCGLSVSGKGLFCVIKIADPEFHKECFYALEHELKDMGIVIDGACSDVARCRVYSYDDDAYCNRCSSVYCKMLESRVDRKVKKNNAPKSQCEFTPVQVITQQEQQEYKPPTLEELTETLLNPTNGNNIKVLVKTNKQEITDLVAYVVEYKIDITVKLYDWFVIRCIMKNIFGEDGRVLYHKISQFYDGYTVEETDMVYSRDETKYKIATDKIFKIAELYGILRYSI